MGLPWVLHCVCMRARDFVHVSLCSPCHVMLLPQGAGEN